MFKGQQTLREKNDDLLNEKERTNLNLLVVDNKTQSFCFDLFLPHNILKLSFLTFNCVTLAVFMGPRKVRIYLEETSIYLHFNCETPPGQK